MTSYAPRKGMTDREIDDTVSRVLADATLSEKVAMMSGHGFLELYRKSNGRWGADPYRAGGGCERLGVPALMFTDGPRGVARGASTCFPCTIARGATFDTELERRIGEIMAIETRAQGCNLSGAVCINLLRHPAWGRAQETYGEDTHHLGEMGAALAEGIQTHNVIATVKHFALNSMENARFKVDVRCGERAMREVYLPHFKRVLESGCASVMSAYNKWNGEYCGQNRALLTDILRGDWGFDGFVHSDWVLGVRDVSGVTAGLDIENPEPSVWGERLEAAVRQGVVDAADIDRACRRILRTLYRFVCAHDPLEHYSTDLVACDAHRAVAREAALKSAVLLENDGVLPFDRKRTKKIALLGKLARLENIGDNGSSRVQPPYVVTPHAGLSALLGESAILVGDEDDLSTARAAAESADAIVVLVGYTANEEGEFIPADFTMVGSSRKVSDTPIGGDRLSLALPDAQAALIQAAAESGKPLVVVMQAGSAVVVEAWRTQANAILQTFYSGMEGGHALASLLFGEASPSGKLPFSVARNVEDYPFFDREADSIEYGLFHGYTHLEREGRTPRYAFGHGLGYAPFRYRGLTVRRSDEAIEVSISVCNEGDITAAEIVQFYVAPPGKAALRPRKTLKAFARVELQPGETKTVQRFIPLDTLGWWSVELRDFVLESGEHIVFAGGSSDETVLKRAAFHL